MNPIPRIDRVSRPALLLVAGRAAGFAVSFAIPVVLARIFNRAEFGTYKQLFLIYGTLYGLAQLGMAESLYYFLPRKPNAAGRHVCNALLTLALAGVAGLVLLGFTRTTVSAWMTNSALAGHLLLLGLFLALMLVSAVFEIVMVSRKQHLEAAWTYAGSDLARTLLLLLPALAWWGLHGVLVGAATFAALRLAVMLWYLRHEFGRELRIDFTLWRDQLAYALPFALAVGIEVVQVNFHQYVVASRFDAATFAIYAVGCLQIPLIDLIVTSTASVMMVKMCEEASEGQGAAALALWHDTMCRLAFLIFPLAAFLLLTAHDVIVALFTNTYLASVPIFMLWSLTILPATFAVDAVLRVYAQTRFLLVMNVARLALVAGLIGWFLSRFGLGGAVLVTLLATSAVKAFGVVRIARLMGVSIGKVLPWEQLAAVAIRAGLAALPVVWVRRTVAMPPLASLVCAAALYGATYALLHYASVRYERATVSTPLALKRRLAAWLTEEA